MSMSIVMAAILAAATPAQNAQPEAPIEDGGIIRVGGEGRLAIVDCCGAGDYVMTQTVGRISTGLMIDVRRSTGKWSLATSAEDLKAQKATAAVFIVKDKSMPMSLIAMEAKWGAVNAEGLNEKQLTKEVIRVATVVLGGASSKYEASLMRPVFSPADLDKAGESFTIDSIMLLFPNLAAHGFKQYQIMSFLDACEGGYSPTPQNDVQRKIAAEYKKQK